MEKNQKLPVLGEQEATDPRKIVKWAKQTLTCGRAFPQCFDKVNLLRYCVSKEIRDMWAALTSEVEGAPADDYPSDIDIDSKEEEDLAKKREWHFEWLEAVISYYGTNQTPKSPMPGHRGGKSRSRPKSGFPISRIRDSGQIGIPDFPNPGFRPNRDSRFPEIRDSGQIGIQIRENPDFFCSGQNRDCTLSAAGQAIAFPRRGPWVGKEAHRPMTRSRQRLSIYSDPAALLHTQCRLLFRVPEKSRLQHADR